MEPLYYRPVAQTDACRPAGALPLAGGWCWFERAEVLARGRSLGLIPAAEIPAPVLARLTAPRATVAGLAMDRPQLMGILNVTPDSFSDGGRFLAPEAALAQGRALAAAGADILDIGGESTRPGAADVPVEEEIARTAPLIAALQAGGLGIPVSIDTRKAAVGRAALAAGAALLNDVAAFTYDPALAPLAAETGAPVCLMHAQGLPATMHLDPRYDDVLIEVYEFLDERVAAAEAAGIPRARIVVDPGLGFGKTTEHNVALMRGLALFHGLGCPVLLGVSRKRFVGALGQEPVADRRLPGTLALTVAGLAQGIQIHRVHDVAEVRQGLRLWTATTFGGEQ